MGQIDSKNIEKLNEDYKNFYEAVKYRREESFYSTDNGIIELSYNENPLGAGKLARNAIKYHSDYAHLYPPIGYVSFIQKLANHLNVQSNNLALGAGSVSVINLAIFQYANKGDHVIFSKSSMPWYRWTTIGNNSIPIEIPLKPDMNHDLNSILSAINDKTKVIILSNPHNPTGLYIDEQIILDFLNEVPKEILVIIDQAYYEYTIKKELLLINDITNYPNLLLTRTFSKIHGLAGLRIGYGIGNCKIIAALKAKWLGNMPSISSVATFAAYHAIDDKEHINKSYEFNNMIKDKLYTILRELNIPYLKSEANFIAFNVGNFKNKHHYFKEHGIELTPGSFFGYNDLVRTSFHANIDKNINVIESVIKHLKKSN